MFTVIVLLIVVATLWVQLMTFSFPSSFARAITWVAIMMVLLGLGFLLAGVNIIGIVVGNLNQLSAVSHVAHASLVASFQFLIRDAVLLFYGILLLEPLIAALGMLYIGIQVRKRRLAWVVGSIQIASWGFVLVAMFATSYAAVHGAGHVWLVDGIPQRALTMNQAQYLSFQLFLSFSFGDVVPSLALVHNHVSSTADFLTQLMQFEAVVAHVFWAGVVSSFIGLFWTPARRRRTPWDRWARQANPRHWCR